MERQLSSVEKLKEKIEEIKVAMMVTVEPNGALRSRPMATRLLDAEGNLWFFTNEFSGKVNEIMNDHDVNLSYSHPDKQKYVSISGKANLIVDKEKMKQLWNPILKAWFPDGLEDPNLALLKVRIIHGEYWDDTASKVSQFVKIAKSIVTGGTYDSGDHGKVSLDQPLVPPAAAVPTTAAPSKALPE
ncbi:General stress protein 26 [Catalinimonas alkaloidigena]|uniref:General stress protein 26 n=1 Tax=Catalinimonas alkaloidigena TaxID=1075417 RepID=A0A1G9B371_9BACT|nr:pyridoxamine 5'-phosphate oxidase family protein [Catalinimonas alkaloidigena]SDK33400.1 General stress protein 26 [Catalinimonas alkaloidigena]